MDGDLILGTAVRNCGGTAYRTVAMIDGFESEATVKTFTEKKVT